MIKINIKKNHIKILGHALYDDYGKDIVCAAVSSVVVTTINAISSLDENSIKYEIKEGYISIDIIKESETTRKLIKNMIKILKDLKQDYQENIKINEEV